MAEDHLPPEPERSKRNRRKTRRKRRRGDEEVPLPSVPLLRAQLERVTRPILERFLEGKMAAENAREVTELTGIEVKPNWTNRIIAYGVKTNRLWLSQPQNAALARELDAFPNRGDVQVVDHDGPGGTSRVATAASELVSALVLDVARRRPGPVHVALGIGYASGLVARSLAGLLQARADAPPIVLHALAPPHSVGSPLEIPSTFYAWLSECLPDVGFVDLVAQPLVEASRFGDLVVSPVVREAFEQRGEIDVAVSSIAGAHVHGHLYSVLDRFVGPEEARRLDERGWKGELHLRPYSEDGPIEVEEGTVAVTLFEIDELVDLARRPDRHVVLLCAPCGCCGSSKADALLPLLREPSLHAWNHLVVDRRTVGDVLGRGLAA